MKRIKITGKGQRKIVQTGPGQPRVDPAVVAEVVGAEVVSTGGRQGSGILAYLVSTGGRPGFQDTSRRQKIPLSEADWKKLVRLAAETSTDDRKISPGQVAAFLLRTALAESSPMDEQVKQWVYENHPGAAFDAEVAAIESRRDVR